MIKMPKNTELAKLNNYERKIKFPFMVYADFESILVPENNGKEKSDQSYMNKYQKHVGCSCGYKLVRFSNLVKVDDTVHNFIYSMIE